MNESQEHYFHKTTRTETGKSGFADQNTLFFLVNKAIPCTIDASGKKVEKIEGTSCHKWSPINRKKNVHY